MKNNQRHATEVLNLSKHREMVHELIVEMNASYTKLIVKRTPRETGDRCILSDNTNTHELEIKSVRR